MTWEEIAKVINKTPCPWNPLQTPDWHLAQWRATLIYELKNAGAKTAPRKSKT